MVAGGSTTRKVKSQAPVIARDRFRKHRGNVPVTEFLAAPDPKKSTGVFEHYVKPPDTHQ